MNELGQGLVLQRKLLRYHRNARSLQVKKKMDFAMQKPSEKYLKRDLAETSSKTLITHRQAALSAVIDAYLTGQTGDDTP